MNKEFQPRRENGSILDRSVTETKFSNGNGRAMSWASRGGSMIAGQARSPMVYGALVIFAWLYYYRPEDFIPGLNYIPMAKITGIFAIVALMAGVMSSGKVKVPRAVIFLWLLLFQMFICIPTALWMGGAFSVVTEKFSKAVVVAMLISMTVVTLNELRKLLWIQVSAVALVVTFSILLRHTRNGRLEGIQKGILENPNDLAINIAISFPLGLAFMLHAKGLKKVLWGIALLFMAVGIVLTYSRSGLLAFILSLGVCVWEYGIKGKRRLLVATVVVSLFVGLGSALISSSYRARVESIALGNIEGSGDRGSLEARKTLLKKAFMTALTHPLLGVGPGCFVLVDKGWVVAHNTYGEIAAESGLPGLALFLLTIGAAFKNIAQVRKSAWYQEDAEFRLFTQALWACLVAYLMGAAFASTEFNLYPYFMVGYTCAMAQIATQPVPHGQRGETTLGRMSYGRIARPQATFAR